MNLYPLKFKPILKERLWGGTKLKEVLNKNIESDITGESWELSGVEGDISKVANGALVGTSLHSLMDDQGEALLGKGVVERFGNEFPILIKFIDAKQDLSIQLHPNDELAKEEGTLTDLMNYEEVGEGDTFFINTGKIHAIGAGVLLAEIQQTSDITYRVFDFNRRDKEGNLRELHTCLAVDAIDYEKKDDFKVDYPKQKDIVNPMVDCPYFKTNFMELSQSMKLDLSQRDSFTIYMCVGGTATINNDWGSAPIKKGETILVAASSSYVKIDTQGAKLLEVTI